VQSSLTAGHAGKRKGVDPRGSLALYGVFMGARDGGIVSEENLKNQSQGGKRGSKGTYLDRSLDRPQGRFRVLKPLLVGTLPRISELTPPITKRECSFSRGATPYQTKIPREGEKFSRQENF